MAKVAIQKREYLAAVKPDGLFLILELMHFAHEVLEPESLHSPSDKAVSPQELKMATALIDAMTAEWDPTKYKDQYQNALMQLIEEKAQKRVPRPPGRTRVQPNVIDMVAVLQQSLQRASQKKKTTSSRPAAKRTTSSLVKQKRRSVAA